jgi:hypothetical protein
MPRNHSGRHAVQKTAQAYTLAGLYKREAELIDNYNKRRPAQLCNAVPGGGGFDPSKYTPQALAALKAISSAASKRYWNGLSARRSTNSRSRSRRYHGQYSTCQPFAVIAAALNQLGEQVGSSHARRIRQWRASTVASSLLWNNDVSHNGSPQLPERRAGVANTLR